MTSHATPPATRDSAGGSFLRGVGEIVGVLAVALVLSILVRTFVAQAFYVPSPSMEPTLMVGDRIIASRITGSGVERGDIVVFTDPGGWLDPTSDTPASGGPLHGVMEWIGLAPSQDHLVKRVIGLPGDRVACCDAQQRITVNGQPLVEPYLAPGGTAQVRFDIVVPEGRMFVMGDNRGHSEDSRFHLEVASGTVPLDDVVGPVLFTWWPLSRVQRFTPPETFATVPAAAPAASTGGSRPTSTGGPVGTG